MQLGNIIEEISTGRTTYHRYESGIHESIFHEATRIAGDEFINYLDKIYTDHKKTGEPYFLLVNAGENIQIPLRYVFQKGRELNRVKHPTVPQGGRSVYVFQKTFLVTVLDAFLRIARPQVTRRYLEPHQYDEAVEWLLEGIEQRNKERDNEEARHARNVAILTDIPKVPKEPKPQTQPKKPLEEITSEQSEDVENGKKTEDTVFSEGKHNNETVKSTATQATTSDNEKSPDDGELVDD